MLKFIYITYKIPKKKNENKIETEYIYHQESSLQMVKDNWIYKMVVVIFSVGLDEWVELIVSGGD